MAEKGAALPLGSSKKGLGCRRQGLGVVACAALPEAFASSSLLVSEPVTNPLAVCIMPGTAAENR